MYARQAAPSSGSLIGGYRSEQAARGAIETFNRWTGMEPELTRSMVIFDLEPSVYGEGEHGL